MSVKVSSWVWHGEETKHVAGNEMVLLLALADVADDNGRCRFLTEDAELTYSALASKARCSRSTLIRLVASLREAGLIGHVRGVKGRPNEFTIHVPWVTESGSILEPNASDSVSSATRFGVKADERSSLLRKDVVNSRSPRGSRIPEPFVITDEMRQWAAEVVPLVDVDQVLPEFVDYWVGVPGSKGVKTDWPATWRNGMRKQQQFRERDQPQGALSHLELGQEWMAR